MREQQNVPMIRPAVILVAQANCPIPLGSAGWWMDAAGVLKVRNTDGTDSIGGVPAGDVQVIAAKMVATAALPANVYDNGPDDDGIGATLVRSVVGNLGTIDGQTPDVGDVILVTAEAAAKGNGIYVVTVKGSGSAKYKLTRLGTFDTSDKMIDGTIFVIGLGTTYKDTTWKYDGSTDPVVGTDDLTFSLSPLSITYGAASDMAANGLAPAGADGVSSKVLRADAQLKWGGDLVALKEVDHVIKTDDSTTAATAGGAQTVKGGKGKTSGAGGAAANVGGAGDTTGTGGTASTRGGAGGSASGAGGAADLTGGAGTLNADGGAATVDGGAKNGSGTDGVVNLGTTNASAINFGRAGKLITRKGPKAAAAATDTIADPGGANAAIPVTQDGVLMITTAGAETNTLAIPTYVGQRLALIMDTRVGGDRVVTSAQAINQAGNTIMTFGAAADMIVLEGMKVGGALRWRVTANDGVALS